MSEVVSVTKHRFTVEEYHKMGEAGIFGGDDRIELIDGEVVEMAAMGDRHVECVMRLNRLLSRWSFLEVPEEIDLVEGETFFVSPQSSLRVSGHGEPQPDLVLLRRHEGATGTPIPEEALLVVEVADTSLSYDRERKLPLYAAAGIPEAWLVDLTEDRLEVHSAPESGGAGYGNVSRYVRGEEVVSATVPGLIFDAAEALPPG
jgi:Uma2 family endonuclease